MLRDHPLSDVKPQDGKILVRMHGAETTVKLVNPDHNEPEGEVLAVGLGFLLPDGSRAPVTVTVGDMVLLGRAQVTPIKVDGVDCFIVGTNAIEAIVGRKCS
jgi:co-chaperonin GroES (HSP10)